MESIVAAKQIAEFEKQKKKAGPSISTTVRENLAF
jgi:hypothetical protein